MPGLNLKAELQLYKKKLEDIVAEINFQNERIMLKQILFAAQEKVKTNKNRTNVRTRKPPLENPPINMPGLTLKEELRLFQTRLQHLVSDIEWYYDLITFKQIMYKAQSLMRTHIDLIEDLENEIEENSINNSIQKIEFQRKRAKILLQPFQGLDNIEKLLKEARENSIKNLTPNLVSEPGTQS